MMSDSVRKNLSVKKSDDVGFSHRKVIGKYLMMSDSVREKLSVKSLTMSDSVREKLPV